MVLCRDRLVDWPDSIQPGRDCDIVVPGPGWACPEHHAAIDAIMSTPISDVPDEREAKAAREAKAMDPAVAARIAEARTYLKECEGQPGIPEFIAGLLADPKYGTKWFRITEPMADAILRTRDAFRARRATVTVRAESQPRLDDVLGWMKANATTNGFAASLSSAYAKWGSLTQKQYDAVVRNLDQSATPGQPAAAPASEGWYKVGDDIFKVQRAVHGSGNLYAKRLVVSGHGSASWAYEPGMVRKLTEADRLSHEDAAAFGRLYGVCGVCGATLTDEDSIAAGIGPVCSKRL